MGLLLRRARLVAIIATTVLHSIIALPAQNDLARPLPIVRKHARPFALQDGDVSPFLTAFFVPVGAGATTIVVMLYIKCHPIASHYRPVLFDVGTRIIIILFER